VVDHRRRRLRLLAVAAPERPSIDRLVDHTGNPTRGERATVGNQPTTVAATAAGAACTTKSPTDKSK